MRVLKGLLTSSILLLLMASFSQCSSVPKLQENAPLRYGNVYYQEWTAGVQGGGSGINLFIPVQESDIILESVYFRGRRSKLEIKPANLNLYIGRFKTQANQPFDIVLSSEQKEESTNKMPQKDIEFPFNLNDDECVVTYRSEGKLMYFKISDIKKESPVFYPSAQPEQD